MDNEKLSLIFDHVEINSDIESALNNIKNKFQVSNHDILFLDKKNEHISIALTDGIPAVQANDGITQNMFHAALETYHKMLDTETVRKHVKDRKLKKKTDMKESQ
jgi:hypothetical protein